MDISSLEKIINKKIKNFDKFYGQSSFERTLLIKEVWISLFSEIDINSLNKILWAGFNEDSNSIKIQLISDPKEGSILHQKFKTDSNLYIGYFIHDKETNSFKPSTSINFFIDSWYGSMTGTFNPFNVLSNSFYAVKKIA